jgi:sec-independent protein translocase protein TatB
MNIFSNLGITEVILILLLALLVVGPERLPELARKLGSTLRDLRRAYDNLTRDLGPELASFQETAQELRESVDSVRNIPQDMVGSMVKSAELEGTMEELKGVRDTVGQMGQTLTDTQKIVGDPINTAVSTARNALSPGEAAAEPEPDETTESTSPASAAQAAGDVESKEAGDTPPGSGTPSEIGTAVEASVDAVDGAVEEAPLEQTDE